METSASWDPQNPQMHVGTQRFTTSDEHLGFLERFGVNSMAVNDITFSRDYGWDAEELAAKKEKCKSYGVDMEMVALPIHRFNEDGGSVPNYMLGNREKGEKEIELVCKMVRATADAGIPAIKYFLCEMENQRTESTPPGRGWREIFHLGPLQGRRGHAPVRQARDRGGELGADHLFSGTRHSRCRGMQGAHGLPPVRSVAAAGV